jgi:ribonuclease E
MKKEMLINVLQPEESRIAIVEDGILEELYVERNSQENYVGNIYKGKVVNIEPSIQAVFVDFGVGRNGFLHVSDVEYQYYKHLLSEDERKQIENPPKPKGPKGKRFNERSARNKPSIQEIFQRGSEVLVQVIKEGIGTKGPTLSTYISIPGRYLVLMPGLQRVGVSRKIDSTTTSAALRKQPERPQPACGTGLHHPHCRHRPLPERPAAGHELPAAVVADDRAADQEHPAPVDIYEESDMIIRTIRDIYTSEIDTIWIDEPAACERARDFIKVVLPQARDRVKQYEGKDPMFHRTTSKSRSPAFRSGRAAQRGRVDRHRPDRGAGRHRRQQRQFPRRRQRRGDRLPGQPAGRRGNRPANPAARSGRRDRQRLHRHADDRHRRGVETTLRDAVERDRARTKVLRISPFGLIEMTRQRIRPSLRRSVYEDCPCCSGVGQVKTAESMAIEVMRTLMTSANNKDVRRVDVAVHQRVANFLINRKRREIIKLEEDYEVTVNIQSLPDTSPEHLAVRCFDEIGSEIKLLVVDASKKGR